MWLETVAKLHSPTSEAGAAVTSKRKSQYATIFIVLALGAGAGAQFGGAIVTRLTDVVYLGTVTAPNSADTSSEPGVTVQASSALSLVDPPRIGVRGSQFVIRGTNQVLAPRGVNWNRHQMRNLANGQPEWWYSTFDAGQYNAEEAQRVLTEISKSKYMYVRVFISGQDPDKGFGLSGPGLSATYIANIGDFLYRARNLGMYVVLTGQFEEGQWLPKNYLSIANTSHVANTEGINQLMLNPGYVRALAQFYADLVRGLKALPDDPTSAILSIDIHNEMSVNKLFKPYSMSSGRYAFNGKSYDLASDDQRQSLIDDSTVQWINTIADSIRAVDSQILLGPSAFTIGATGNLGFHGAKLSEGGDGRAAIRPSAIARSSADYVDIHIYPYGPNYTLEGDLTRNEVGTSLGKPLVMGEVGVFRKDYPNREAADRFLIPALASSCKFGFSAWAFWDWDSIDNKGGPWAVIEENGAMNALFAPSAVPNLCTPSKTVAPVVARSAGSIEAEGFFRVKDTIFYSNGKDAFCAKGNWDDFINSGGKEDQSNVSVITAKPTGMRDDGVCRYLPQPLGYFTVNGLGIFYSNGKESYCVYKDWQAYVASSGTDSQANVRILKSGLPAGMRNDGYCQNAAH
jgi:hypothetical protein